MPPRSSAKFISYDLRPGKQAERRIMIDLLKIAGDCGLPITSYRYVGMGANRFYDFLLFHKYLGLKDMVSLEHDPVMFKRAVFNVPFGFIDVQPLSSADFIATDAGTLPTIYWLDYDGGIGEHILNDVVSLSMKLKVGDFCFVTVYGGPPKAIDRESDEGRLVWLQDQLGAVAGDVTLSDVERSNFPIALHKILIATFKNAFAPRRDGAFVPLLQVEYSDSQPMITIGGAFLVAGQAVAYRERMASSMPFLSTGTPQLYEIKSLNLTERERGMFDRAVTAKKARSKERSQLRRMGFKEPELRAYEELVRYLPRYVETMV